MEPANHYQFTLSRLPPLHELGLVVLLAIFTPRGILPYMLLFLQMVPWLRASQMWEHIELLVPDDSILI